MLLLKSGIKPDGRFLALRNLEGKQLYYASGLRISALNLGLTKTLTYVVNKKYKKLTESTKKTDNRTFQS